MPSTIKPSNAPPASPLLAVGAAATFVLSVCLLIAGSIAGHMPLLAWGVVSGVLAVALGCLVAVRSMIECAVARSVDRTAVQVGSAIAAALSDDRPREDGTLRLYS